MRHIIKHAAEVTRTVCGVEGEWSVVLVERDAEGRFVDEVDEAGPFKDRCEAVQEMRRLNDTEGNVYSFGQIDIPIAGIYETPYGYRFRVKEHVPETKWPWDRCQKCAFHADLKCEKCEMIIPDEKTVQGMLCALVHCDADDRADKTNVYFEEV